MNHQSLQVTSPKQFDQLWVGSGPTLPGPLESGWLEALRSRRSHLSLQNIAKPAYHSWGCPQLKLSDPTTPTFHPPLKRAIYTRVTPSADSCDNHPLLDSFFTSMLRVESNEASGRILALGMGGRSSVATHCLQRRAVRLARLTPVPGLGTSTA